MLVENLLNLLSMMLDPIIDVIPVAGNFAIPDNVLGYLLALFRAIGTFLPVLELLPLFMFVAGLYMYKFFSAIIFRVRSLF